MPRFFRPTEIEAQVARSVLNAEPVDYTDRRLRPEIRGSLLRYLMLGHPILGIQGAVVVPIPGIRIRGCCIRGPVDLADFARPGGGLPALVLESCEFDGIIDLTGARVARLSLKDSRFSHVILREAEVDGPFDFSGAAPNDLGGLAWIDARDGLFHGQVTGSSAHLAAPRRPDHKVAAGDKRYALWLHNADIRGSLVLFDLFAAGGVGIGASHIRGNVWLRGATLLSGEDDALNAQNARIGGSLVADRGFSSIGTLWLLGAHFGNSVQLSDATLRVGPDAVSATEGATAAVILQNADIGTNLGLDGATVTGQVLLEAAKLGAKLDASGLVLHRFGEQAAIHDESALAAAGICVAGNVTFDDACISGGIDFTGADVGGSFSAARAVMIHHDPERGTRKALSLANASIGKKAALGCAVAEQGGAPPRQPRLTIECTGPELVAGTARRLLVRVTPARVAAQPMQPVEVGIPIRPLNGAAEGNVVASTPAREPLAFFARGEIDISGATFQGDLIAQDCILDNRTADGTGKCLVADRAHVRGNLVLGQRFGAVGRVNLSAAEIGRDLRFDRADFVNPATSARPDEAAIFGKDLKIGSNFEFEATAVFGNIILERLELTGSLTWGAAPNAHARSGLLVSADENHRQSGFFDLGLSEIGTALKPRDLALCSDVELRLGGARAAQLELHWPDGWGGWHMPMRRGQLDLDGFRYDRIVADPGVMPRHAAGWLRCHARKSMGAGFSPHPYRQLARVLRTQGDEAGARGISITERWRTPQPWWLRPFWIAYGGLFGFGLKPAAALVTLLVWVGVGTMFVYAANAVGVLKEAMVVSSTVISEDAHGALNVIPFVTAASQDRGGLPPQQVRFLHEIPCSDTALDIGDDVVFALDMMLPFIPLHQQSRCEISSGHDVAAVSPAIPAAALNDPPSENAGGRLPEWLAREVRDLPIWAWRIARAVYTVIGWIFVSLALVTFAGVVKRTETSDAE
jgi:hypothetical protein